MKHGFKRITKTTIALVLALCVLISVAVPVMAAGIQTLIGRVTELSLTGSDEPKGEKITGADGKEFYRLDSMTEAQYASFGLNTKATPKTFSSSPESEVDSYTELDGLMPRRQRILVYQFNIGISFKREKLLNTNCPPALLSGL